MKQVKSTVKTNRMADKTLDDILRPAATNTGIAKGTTASTTGRTVARKSSVGGLDIYNFIKTPLMFGG